MHRGGEKKRDKVQVEKTAAGITKQEASPVMGRVT
tara:strand:- start:88 stop:192 length:105 start_codon:yes stop_codon:yes gene_type:complete